jgi:hypothetical protein
MRAMRAVVCGLLLAGAASADTAKPCLPPDAHPTLDVVGGKPVVCTARECWTVDPAGTLAPATRPPAATPIDTSLATKKFEPGKAFICLGAKCKRAGKRLQVAMQGPKEGPHTDFDARHPLHATPDLGVVLFGDQPWTLATDKPLSLAPPAEFQKLHEPPVKFPRRTATRVTGKILVATWADCTDQCTDFMSVTADTRGKTQSGWFPAGALFELDADRAVVLGDDQTQVTAFSPQTGKMIGAYTMSDGNIVARGAKLDDATLVVLTTAGGYDVHWVDIAKDKVPTRRARATIATCPRKP